MPHYCESIGNNYGIGETRKRELEGSCEALGIDEARCVVLDRPDIQDSPTVWWDESVIQTIVAQYIQDWHVDAVS
jgi:N-acetylglucosaminylphosphatidylinositol deacetylase